MTHMNNKGNMIIKIVFIAFLKTNITNKLLHIKEMIKSKILKCNKEKTNH